MSELSDLLRDRGQDGEAIGERIIVHDRVLGENARPVTTSGLKRSAALW